MNQIAEQARTLAEELNLPEKKARLKQLEAQSAEPNFWDQGDAKQIMQEIAWLREKVEQIEKLKTLAADLATFEELKDDIEDAQQLKKLEQEAQNQQQKLKKLIAELELEKYLSGKFDKNHAILSIHPGQGGTEAMDWAEMLERMYLRYFERKNWKYQIINETRGEEAGIKEASFEVMAPYAYGYLKGERGTHRLIRLSPFNADSLRQTSFSLVEVMPVIENDQEIKLKQEDLNWHFTRSGGPGGQSVNKTNSAVELTHEPTGITVKSRQARSQVENKAQALKMLKAKLAQRQEEEIEQALHQEKGQHQQASWGTQIRNYVLHPYQLVKDTRTEVETSDTEAVLDGDLDQFIQEEIKLKS